MNRSTNRSVSGDRKSRPYSVSVTAGIGKLFLVRFGMSHIWRYAEN
jgi:hypothetical protein